MAGGSWWQDSPNLRSLFPSIVSAASQGASTSEVWDAIRGAAGSIASQVLSTTLGRNPTEQEVLESAKGLLSGISATDVSAARGAAGQMVRAHNALLAASDDAQITSEQIGRAPWSTTTNVAGVNEQYRIRVQRSITVKGFTEIQTTEWGTYDLSGPLTSIADAVSQANNLWSGRDYNKRASINQVLDYVIEAV